ncbi:MAG: MMPL family transporter, partial [SAR324 cluster bacterium]|nr:MMPL family transporter [SAR324 cluster bacterium]
MTSFRTRIDFYFAGFGRMVFRHRFKTLLVMALVIAAFLSQLPKLTVDTSNESYFHKDDPTIGDYDAFREQFGRESYVIIPIEPPEIFDTAFLRKLKAFHEKLQEEVPYLEDITSLVNVRNTRGDGDVLVVEDLLKVIPETPEKMARFKGLALSSKLYRNFLISEDGKVTNVIIETFAYSPGKGEEDLAAGFQEDEGKQEEAGEVRTPLTQEENRELVQAVNRIAAEFNGPDFPLIVAGGPPTDEFFDRMMQKDMGQFLMLAVLSIAILLFLLFRRFSGVLLPLLVVILSLLSTIGVMAAAGVPFTIPTLILPSFLLAMGIGAGVHLMAVFYRYYEAGGDKEQALVDTLEHSGFPILMTSLTTAAGLFAFSNAEMAPVAHLGIFAGIGVLLAFVYTLVLTPALLAILPIHRTAWIGKGRGTGGFDRLLVGIADFATSRALGIVLVSAVVMVLAIGGLFSLRFSMNFLDWFPKDLELRKGIELVDERFKGSMNLEVVVDTGKENGLYEPKVLNQMEALARYAEQQTKPDGRHYVGKTNSVVDVLKEINKALNENREEFYTVP